MEAVPIKSSRIEPKDILAECIAKSLSCAKQKLKNGDILCIVSKVVALTEGGLFSREELEKKYKISTQKSASKNHNMSGTNNYKRYGAYPADPILAAHIEKESDILFPGNMFLAIKDGILTPSAGVDTSNVPTGSAIGWPKDSYASARALELKLKKTFHLARLGILIFDSYITPLRNGITGIALGYSGFHGVEDCRGKKDLFGKSLKVTRRNLADGLAATATLVTGEGGESIPFVLIRSALVKFTSSRASSRITPREIRVPPKKCLYGALFRNTLD